MGRKHCGKKRNCSLRAISPSPTMFSKELYYRHVKTRACLGKGSCICSPDSDLFILYIEGACNVTDHRSGQIITRQQNFRLVQIKGISRRQIGSGSKDETYLSKGKKHRGKEKMLDTGIFPLLFDVFSGVHPRVCIYKAETRSKDLI